MKKMKVLDAFFREKGDQGGGVGKGIIVDGTGKYKDIIGLMYICRKIL